MQHVEREASGQPTAVGLILAVRPDPMRPATNIAVDCSLLVLL